MLAKVICTTILIEKSPQALPLGAACVASAIKNSPLTRDLCTVYLCPFCQENSEYIKHASTQDQAAEWMAQQLILKSQGDGSPGAGVAGQRGQGQSVELGVSNATEPYHGDGPLIVAFSVFVWNRLVLEKTARILRQQGVICIAGGPEVTANPKSFTDFDYVTTMEGELRVPYLISKILSGDKEALREENLQLSLSPLSCPLDQLSSPYLDGTLDPAEYDGALWELARGCPFKCSYCYESKGEKVVRKFPMERIEKELDLFARKKIGQVFVLDPTYNANKERAVQLVNLIAKKTPDTFYYFEARAEFIDRQMAKAFTKIPCALQIGLQSANEEVLKLVNRPFNRKQFVKNIGFLNEAGVTFGFDLIYGLPGETFKSFKEGIDFALSLYPNNLEIFCLSVLPGTDLFDHAKDLHLNYMDKPPYHIINTDKFSNQDIQHASHLAQACNVFYNDGRAVPWFNIITHHLHIKAPEFFDRFYNEEIAENISQSVIPVPFVRTQSEIEKLQQDFVTKLCKEKKMDRYIKVMTDLIRYYGAISRKTDTGKTQTVQLNYPEEYLCSEYIFDLDFFTKNVKINPCSIRI